MHIQGSGKINLPDGSYIRVGYKAQNGHPYYPIGKYLIDQNHVDRKTMNAYSIQDWLYGNSHKASCVMELNPSYVFFHQIYENGAIGAQSVVLTPERSIAIDKNYFPYGAPFWIDTIYPEQDMRGNKYFRRLMVAQDTGGAIKSPIRADIFFGTGRRAEDLASNMNHFGSYYILLPKKK